MDERLKEHLLEVLKDIVPYAKGIVVYGSAVKGCADERSDLSLIHI